ncbi:hypothetical protein NDU88_003828 [Pleurodeles waltl]|uniref:Uncharacterized protein n=1 Tax=Pleurodeles waltl TaxID=8319 RepID=A0AAV7SH15_PLEWA|nr:hypothetical protein NDU88_003828 [Pleurodeles waltl]
MGATVGARATIAKDLASAEGQLKTDAVLNASQARTLQAVLAEYAGLLERLCIMDYRSYRQRTHSEGEEAGTLLARMIKDRPTPTPVLHMLTSLN